MKRAPTIDKHGRQAAEQYASAAKASLSNEENNPAAESKASGNSPFKKIKLSVRRESASARQSSHAEEAEQRPGTPVSSPRRETVHAGQMPQPDRAAMCHSGASMPVLRDAGSTHAAMAAAAAAVAAEKQPQVPPGPAETTLSVPGTDTAARRQQWLAQDKPSFVFDEITDPVLLALCDQPAPAAASAASAPQPGDRERKRQFKPVADGIKAALEGVLAKGVRRFMEASRQDNARTAQFQAAHHAFSELIQLFNKAKIAAVDGKEAEMIAELRAICPALEQFMTQHLKDVARQFNAEKSEREALKTGLHGLLDQCREWLGEHGEDAGPTWSPSVAPSSPQSRQRSASSPAKPNEPWAGIETAKASRLSATFPGPIGFHPSQHRLTAVAVPGAAPTPSPASTPPGSPLGSPVHSPKAVVSPKDNAKSFRLSTLLGSPGSPRAKDASRRDSSVREQNRKSLLGESASQSSLPAHQDDKPATAEKAKTEKSKKKFS